MAHKTYIREVVGADTAVLFIHGFLGSTEHFEKFVSLIPDTVSVYNILLSGHGGTVRDLGRASMAQWKKQIYDVVDSFEKNYNNVYIVAHSMGTFFAMDASITHPRIVKGIFLMQAPLKIGVKIAAATNAFRSFFDRFNDDAIAHAYKKAHSVKLNCCLWQYLSWIPRCLELFEESRKSRATIYNVSVPCYIFLSKRDEFVSVKSEKYIPNKENIKVIVLPKSSHFIYDEDEFVMLENEFCKMIGECSK